MDALDQRQLRQQQTDRLAADIIDEARVQLMLRFRFLDLALWRMEVEPYPVRSGYALATDGKKVYCDSELMLARFEESFDEVVRDCLHMIMHCLFRHPFDETHDREEAWWLACNVMAESAAMDLCGTRFPSADDAARRQALSELRLLCGALTPGSLYNLFLKAFTAPHGTVYRGLGTGRLNELASLFERDNHEAWPSHGSGDGGEEAGDIHELGQPDGSDSDEPSEDALQELMASAEAQQADEQPLQPTNPDAEGSDAQGEDADASGGEDDGAQASDEPQDEAVAGSPRGQSSDDGGPQEVQDEKSADERDWEDIAKQVEVDLETFSREWGEEAGSLIACLRIANRKRYDYSDFLRRFSMLSEEMRINDDEFDNIFYTYGLELYGNMPLIEPLEYKETQRIRDFVIAIDTSESCQGDLVRRFLAHTFDILKAQEDFAHSVSIHVIQCDAKVQADTEITDLRDVDRFMEGFHIRGMGGTDFRPVFGYVDDLRNQGKLPSMKGLIYFTDGLGTYPEAAPDFDTAFVFMDSGELHTPSVPPWAMKVIIDEEGISRFRGKMQGNS